jgi:glycosyltransferase involved in cell wall biosynthesis
MEILNIIVSTFDRGIEKLEESWYPKIPDLGYLIVHQKSPGNNLEIKPTWFNERQDIRYLSMEELGLSKSRNFGVKNSYSKFILITDDDVRFIPSSLESFVTSLKIQKESLFYVLKTGYIDEAQFRVYMGFTKSDSLTLQRQILSICSVEMCFPRSLWDEVKFNEKIGKGTKFPIGEDTLFCFGAFKKGVAFSLYPTQISTLMDKEHSGSSNDKDIVYSQGIFAAYIWKFHSLFLIKKIFELMIDIGSLKSDRMPYYKGLLEYYRKKKFYDIFFKF